MDSNIHKVTAITIEKTKELEGITGTFCTRTIKIVSEKGIFEFNLFSDEKESLEIKIESEVKI